MNARRASHTTVLLLSVFLADCVARVRPVVAPPAATVVAPIVRDLRSVRDLAAAFDHDRNHPRVVLLLSPT